MDILAGALVVFLGYVFVQNKKDPKKLFGVYSQPGKWYFIKYPLFLTLLVLRRLKYYINGKETGIKVENLEKRQPLSENPLVSLFITYKVLWIEKKIQGFRRHFLPSSLPE